jgi:hypothetical protein
MHEIRTEIDIEGTPERLWAVLNDFAAYPSWNPSAGGKAMTFRPTVLVAKPNCELRWLGHLLFRGVFDGEHYFEIAPIANAPGRVRFVQGEKFNGFLVGLAKAKLDDGTKARFVAMNQSLKTRVENGPG